MPGTSPAPRIALFGGSFDPPHRGHIAIARAAADTFQLDRVLFAPAGRQPLKPEGAAASYADRLAMTTLACVQDARFTVSEVDAPRPDGAANFTVDALEATAAAYPGATLYNIVGMDSFLQLNRWQNPRRLLQIAEWIVVSRPGVAPAYPQGLAITRAEASRIHQLTWVNEDVSATELRDRIHRHMGVDARVPNSVAEYIRMHGLYGYNVDRP